jgi:hypothetical protein
VLTRCASADCSGVEVLRPRSPGAAEEDSEELVWLDLEGGGGGQAEEEDPVDGGSTTSTAARGVEGARVRAEGG